MYLSCQFRGREPNSKAIKHTFSFPGPLPIAVALGPILMMDHWELVNIKPGKSYIKGEGVKDAWVN